MWGFFLHNLGLNSAENIWKISNISKASRIDQVSAKCLKDGAPVISNHITNTINLSIKLDTFSLKCKIAKIKLLFKKIIKTEAKNYGPIPLLPLISDVTEKNRIKTRIILKEMSYCTVINQTLEQIIPQILACLR